MREVLYALLAAALASSAGAGAEEQKPLVCMGPSSCDNGRMFRQLFTQPDDYALQETAAFIALVRKRYPEMAITEIETYPTMSLAEHQRWIEALEKRLKELGVRGLDAYRLDVNWAVFTAQNRGSWREVRKLEQYCRARKLPFELIYWASDLPAMRRLNLADDSTWYVSIMRQGYDYALVQGAPDHYIIQSWVDAPAKFLRPDRSRNKEIMPDLLHLSPEGYKLWAAAVEPVIAREVGPK